MRRTMPEFVAVPVTLVGIGIVLVILWAADASLATFLIVGAVMLVALIVVAVIAMRRPRGSAVGGEGRVFEGGAPRIQDGVHRALIVIDDECATDDLVALVGGHDRTSVFVVAPAVSSRVSRWTGDERAYEDATEHLASTIRVLEGLGVDAKGHVAAHDPLQAADEALREFPANEIVFVLNRSDEAKWLEEGILDLARARYSIPVRELTASAANGGER